MKKNTKDFIDMILYLDNKKDWPIRFFDLRMKNGPGDFFYMDGRVEPSFDENEEEGYKAYCESQLKKKGKL